MKKTLEEILSEAREQAQATVSVIDRIDRLIAESKAAGVEWPETEETEVSSFNDVE